MKLSIVMHCLGMPFNGDTIKQQSLGGSESAAYYMAKELAAMGHNVILFTNTDKPGLYDGVSYEYVGQPNEQAPLGHEFHKYAENIPHDILIIQRHPAAFLKLYASKINVLWLHDLALHRTAAQFAAQMWNIQSVWTVSEYHKKQVCDVYGFTESIVMPITNGIDEKLYISNIFGEEAQLPNVFDQKKKNLIYSSRPERGLENLVKPDGIMQKLHEQNSNFHLYVCGYDNTTQQMAQFYHYLWQRCEELPNVTNLGPLTKKQLADLQKACDAWVYPTTFEEVSCITAMEIMSTGGVIVASKHAALPETIGTYENYIPVELDNDQVNIVSFITAIKNANLDKIQPKFITWKSAAEKALTHISNIFHDAQKSKGAIGKTLMQTSDIVMLDTLLQGTPTLDNEILFRLDSDMSECYEFYINNTYKEHYDAYYQYEMDRGQNYGPENLQGNHRFMAVSDLLAGALAKLSISSAPVVYDIGCAHGHYTVNLAKMFPNIRFIGIDIAQSNIDKARKWADEEKLTNIQFVQCDIEHEDLPDIDLPLANAVLACEVVEHVGDPTKFLQAIKDKVSTKDTIYLVTTPYGPWEAAGYIEHWPWRAHLWHLDYAQIRQLFGACEEFKLATIPAGSSKTGEKLGSYAYTFKLPETVPAFQSLTLTDKISTMIPTQTVALCMIVYNAEATLMACLKSVIGVVDEVVISLDEKTNDNTLQVIDNFKAIAGAPPVSVHTIPPVLDTGFAAARNSSIIHTSADWILWMDADETLQHGHNLQKYLKPNMFNGYAIQQHHFAVEPLGVLKTDLPCRIFRNNIGMKFFGVVHEHPELALNDGPGSIQVIGDVAIAHNGYTTEEIRRKRFERNIGLMHRDRKENPTRILGKFLWIRDLAQMITYQLEQTGGQLQPHHFEMAKEGMQLWEELIKDKQTRMLADGMQYYSVLARLLGQGFECSFAIKTSKLNGGADLSKTVPISGFFHSKEHVNMFITSLLDQESSNYESRYF